MKFYLLHGDRIHKYVLIANRAGYCTMQGENNEIIIHGWAGEFVATL